MSIEKIIEMCHNQTTVATKFQIEIALSWRCGELRTFYILPRTDRYVSIADLYKNS